MKYVALLKYITIQLLQKEVIYSGLNLSMVIRNTKKKKGE